MARKSAQPRVGYDVRPADSRVPGHPQIRLFGFAAPSKPDQAWRVDLGHVDLPGFAFVLELGDVLDVRAVRVLAGVHVDGDPRPAVSEVTSRLLRRMPLGELHAAARSWVLDWIPLLDSMTAPWSEQTNPQDAGKPHPWASGVAAHLRSVPEKRGRPGRPGYTELYRAQVAARYVELAMTHRDPIARLAAERQESIHTTRQLIADTRRLGFLTPTVRGRAGGTLTDNASKLLAQAQED